jgi:hypothetical protein
MGPSNLVGISKRGADGNAVRSWPYVAVSLEPHKYELHSRHIRLPFICSILLTCPIHRNCRLFPLNRLSGPPAICHRVSDGQRNRAMKRSSRNRGGAYQSQTLPIRPSSHWQQGTRRFHQPWSRKHRIAAAVGSRERSHRCGSLGSPQSHSDGSDRFPPVAFSVLSLP